MVERKTGGTSRQVVIDEQHLVKLNSLIAKLDELKDLLFVFGLKKTTIPLDVIDDFKNRVNADIVAGKKSIENLIDNLTYDVSPSVTSDKASDQNSVKLSDALDSFEQIYKQINTADLIPEYNPQEDLEVYERNVNEAVQKKADQFNQLSRMATPVANAAQEYYKSTEEDLKELENYEKNLNNLIEKKLKIQEKIERITPNSIRVIKGLHTTWTNKVKTDIDDLSKKYPDSKMALFQLKQKFDEIHDDESLEDVGKHALSEVKKILKELRKEISNNENKLLDCQRQIAFLRKEMQPNMKEYKLDEKREFVQSAAQRVQEEAENKITRAREENNNRQMTAEFNELQNRKKELEQTHQGLIGRERSLNTEHQSIMDDWEMLGRGVYSPTWAADVKEEMEDCLEEINTTTKTYVEKNPNKSKKIEQLAENYFDLLSNKDISVEDINKINNEIIHPVRRLINNILNWWFETDHYGKAEYTMIFCCLARKAMESESYEKINNIYANLDMYSRGLKEEFTTSFNNTPQLVEQGKLIDSRLLAHKEKVEEFKKDSGNYGQQKSLYEKSVKNFNENYEINFDHKCKENQQAQISKQTVASAIRFGIHSGVSGSQQGQRKSDNVEDIDLSSAAATSAKNAATYS